MSIGLASAAAAFQPTITSFPSGCRMRSDPDSANPKSEMTRPPLPNVGSRSPGKALATVTMPMIRIAAQVPSTPH